MLNRLVRGTIAFLRAVFDGAETVDIPDALRTDAGLVRREPERAPEPWDRSLM